MRRAPIRIRTFILGIVLLVLLVPTLAGGAAWFIEGDHQLASVRPRLNTALAYLSSHRQAMQAPSHLEGFARLLGRLNLLAELVLVSSSPPGKSRLYVSPALAQGQTSKSSRSAAPTTAAPGPKASWSDDRELIPLTTPGSRSTLVVDLFYPPPSRAAQALVALLSGIVVLFASLAVVVWLVGRWLVAPLKRLSGQVDRLAGGELTIAVPRSRIDEVENIARAVEGMTAALGETAQRRAEADEARRFLVTSIAHDLRTPLFALRGHLQAIGSRLGNPAIHLERAEARADALERLVGNLFAYTRDDYAQPAAHLEAIPIVELLHEVTAGLEHATRLRDNAFDLHGDQTLRIIVDRDRVKRALTNVLDNALRYSPAGAPIQLSWATVDNSTARITIQDNGPGIDPRLLPHIFEPGIRGTPAVGNPESGAGLGLTIAKRLLEHQHATIAAHNQTTGGTTISLTFRRVEDSPRA